MIDKSDYEEPRCPMDNSMWVKKEVTPIPTGRVVSKEDEYFAKKDYDGAERHLMYWLGEAEAGNDESGKLLIFNELMGLHRKLGKSEKAKEYAEKAVVIMEALKINNTASGATTYLNAGTVYKAFGEPEKSLEYFEKCRAVYEIELEAKDTRKAGLYNNMALALVELGRYEEARKLYLSALEIVKDESKPDKAITLLNLADCAVSENGLEDSCEESESCINAAEKALDAVPDYERDAYFAFVCEKCAPVFDYYGYFAAAKKFKKIAASIYEAGK